MKTSSLLPAFAAAVALLSLGAANALAELIISTSSSAPASPYIRIPESGVQGSNVRWGYTSDTEGNRRELGQTFYTGSSDISVSAFTFRVTNLYSNQPASAPMTLKLYEFSSATDFEPQASPIFTISGNLAISTLAVDDYLTFTLPEAQTLDANKYYGVLLAFDGPLSGQRLNLATASQASYTQGHRLYHANDDAADPSMMVWYDTTGHMYTFITATQIPESSAMIQVSLIAGLALIGFWKGRTSRK